MVDGIIILQPYANQIISGTKKIEYKRRVPPLNKFQTPIYLLSGGKILGTIMIESWTDHQGTSSSRAEKYVDWKIRVIQKYDKPKKYAHPNGAQVWVLDVKLAR